MNSLPLFSLLLIGIGLYVLLDNIIVPSPKPKPRYIKPLPKPQKMEKTEEQLLLELSQQDSVLHNTGICCSLPFEPDDPTPKE